MSDIERLGAEQAEIDNIISLLTYAIVYQDWQPARVPRERRRGYNIGAVLVDRENMPVSHGLNCVTSANDATQHAEVRTIVEYLENTSIFELKGFSLYVTLEPCAMCAGMITMSGVHRTIYGQHDVEFSGAFERLALDSRSIGGFPPYPRTVDAHANSLPVCAALDLTYSKFLAESTERVLAKFLTSDEAERIFASAHAAFLDYQPKYAKGGSVYLVCRMYFDALLVAPD